MLLGQSGHPEYFRDAERIIRNGLLAAQVVTTDWIPQSSPADTKDYAYRQIPTRATGAFAFTLPNSYHSYNTDLMGGSLQSLAEAYQASVTKEEAVVHVNLLFSTDTPWLRVRSEAPRAGRPRLEDLQEERVMVRMPDWGERQKAGVKRDGRRREAHWPENSLDPGNPARGTRVTVSLDQPKRKTREQAPGFPGLFEVEWKGDTIVAMQPTPSSSIALY